MKPQPRWLWRSEGVFEDNFNRQKSGRQDCSRPVYVDGMFGSCRAELNRGPGQKVSKLLKKRNEIQFIQFVCLFILIYVAFIYTHNLETLTAFDVNHTVFGKIASSWFQNLNLKDSNLC